MILVVSSKRDGHITPVADHLDAVGVSWTRINTEDFATNVSLAIDPVTADGFIAVLDSHRRFRLSDVTAVWYRKPDPLALGHFGLEPAPLDYVEAEFNEVLQGIYAHLDKVHWINNPFASRLAHRKLLQLRVADALGFKTPRSLLTNRPDDALRFGEAVGWDIAIKSLGAISFAQQDGRVVRQYGVFTRRIAKDELLRLRDKIQYMPTLFQEYIQKDHELRITCVGDRAFCCRVFSQESEITKEDFRFDARSLRHEIVNRPDLMERLFAYLKHFGLNFGCFDLAVSKNGDTIFFECNPNGQWLWIEELTGAPISAAIAELLMSNDNNAAH